MMNAAASRADVLVFGASGFTGKWIARRIAGHVRDGTLASYALGGRSAARLSELRSELLAEGLPAPLCVAVAEAGDHVELANLASRAKLLISAVGPFRLYGEPVVRACIASGTDYVDISGEPLFLESIAARLNKLATEKGVIVLGSAAFDCVPADLGAAAAADALRRRDFLPTSVLGFLSLTTTGGHALHGHYATFQSAVLGFGCADELKRLRRAEGSGAAACVYGGALAGSADGVSLNTNLFWSAEAKAWAMRFPGADASVVRRTNRAAELRGETPVAFSAFMTLPTLTSLATMLFYGTLFSLLARFESGRNVLLRYPKLFTGGVFSHAGPSQDQIAAARFSYKFVAIGHSPQEAAAVLAAPKRKGTSQGPSTGSLPPATARAVVEVTGPEPGYDATSTMVSAVAAVILRHRSSLAFTGGVTTPGTLFPAGSRACDEVILLLAKGGVRIKTIEEPHLVVVGGERKTSR